MKYARFTLPLTGPVLNHSDFWNVLVGYAYRTAGSADFKLVSNNTKEQLESLGLTEKAKVMGRFTAKIDAATRKVAKFDLEHAEAEPGPAKEGLAAQLQTRTYLQAFSCDTEVSTVRTVSPRGIQ